MIAPIVVLVAHGLDLITFKLAVDRYGMIGESNAIAHLIVGVAGMAGLVVTKVVGAFALSAIVNLKDRYPLLKWSVVPAAGFGILGAITNVWALML